MESVKKNAVERMEKAIESLDRDFGKLRTGRASSALVDDVRVDHYGTPTPIKQVATVTIPDSRTITIQPWDRASFALIEKALMKSDLGITPVNDGKLIRINMPPLTEERRKDLVKVAKKYSEDAKIAIRNIRRDANDDLKKNEKDSSVGEDAFKKAQDEIQKLTDSYIASIDKKCQVKEKEIMEI